MAGRANKQFILMSTYGFANESCVLATLADRLYQWTSAFCTYRWRLLKGQQWLRNENFFLNMPKDLSYSMNTYLS